MKRVLGFLTAALLCAPLGLMAQSNEELLKQIEQLRQQLQTLEQRFPPSRPRLLPPRLLKRNR